MLTVVVVGSFVPLLLLATRSSETFFTPEHIPEFPSSTRRIVSTSLATDEILWDLLRYHKISHELVGVSYLVDEESMSNIAGLVPASIQRVGHDPEDLTTLKPTHIILASFNNTKLLSIAKSLGVKTLMLDRFDSLEDIKSNIFAVSRFLNLDAHGAESLTQDFNAFRKKQYSPYSAEKTGSSALLVNPDFSTTGGGTVVDEVIRASGLINFGDQVGLTGWQKVSPEFLLKATPDFLLLHKSWQNIQQRPKWLAPLFARKKIIYYQERDIFSASHYVLSAILGLRSRVKPVDPIVRELFDPLRLDFLKAHPLGQLELETLYE